MPKRNDIKSILVVGAGPIVIGQACEFDYSGTQACKALKKDGYLSLYFHPWEFVDVTGYGLPAYTTKYAGRQLLDRLYQLLEDLKLHGNFSTMQQFASDHTL